MSAPRLLIVTPDQFGYLTDAHQYSLRLQSRFDVTYLCWDFGEKRFPDNGVNVMYRPRRGSKPVRMARYIGSVLAEIRSHSYDLILVVYFPFCSVIPLMGQRDRMILDIRTGYVRDSRVGKFLYNRLGIGLESGLFRHITIISDSLRELLGLKPAKCHILPLGADELDLHHKDFRELRLLYVGSLDYRNIPVTVRGFARFLEESGNSIDARYDIVGFGSPAVERELIDTIRESHVEHAVVFHGKVPRNELSPFLERSNIGVGFVPIVDHYDCQPATKVFEYLLSGMAVLATDTKENRRVINDGNGVLIDDSVEGMVDGLRRLVGRRMQYRSDRIREAIRGYTWESIIRTNLEPYLTSLLDRLAGSTGGSGQHTLLTSRKDA